MKEPKCMKDNKKDVKEKVIIYALGHYWRNFLNKISAQYDIVACSDKNENGVAYAKGYLFVSPVQICDMCYDKIIIGCKSRGIRETLVLQYGLPANKIFYYDELFGSQMIKRGNGIRKHAQHLTVVIPTYNREQRLQRTLDILELQSDGDFDIILLDNCSEYDVEKVLDNKGVVFRNKVKVVHNKVNIGMAANLANAFIQKTEGWVWMLADDDIPSIYAVEDIYEEIEQCNDVGMIHFSIHDMSVYMGGNGKTFYLLHELMDFYGGILWSGEKIDDFSGDFIYFSNKVYNMTYIKKYYEKIFYYAYSGVPQLVPVLFMLDEGIAGMRISNKKVVTYSSPEGDHWDWIKTILGMRIITDFPLSLNQEDRKILYRLIMSDYIDRLLNNVDINGMDYAIRQIQKIYDEVYCHFFNEKEKCDYQLKIKALMEKNV